MAKIPEIKIDVPEELTKAFDKKLNEYAEQINERHAKMLELLDGYSKDHIHEHFLGMLADLNDKYVNNNPDDTQKSWMKGAFINIVALHSNIFHTTNPEDRANYPSPINFQIFEDLKQEVAEAEKKEDPIPVSVKVDIPMVYKIANMCDGIQYNRRVPKEAKDCAKENNCIIIIGGSDDLMYCYGAESYMTDYCEHSYGWDGDDLKNITDKSLEMEAQQLGLKIWWCGEIKKTNEQLEGYCSDKNGSFSYTVREGIEFKEFKVIEDEHVYCTGMVIQLPEGFKSYKDYQWPSE